MPQAKATILGYLVEPINKREKDSAMFVFEKLRSIIRSCKTIKQLGNAWSWGRSVFYARFPEHYNDFYYTLNGDYDLQFEKIIEQTEKEK
jgi:hypothetical protein